MKRFVLLLLCLAIILPLCCTAFAEWEPNKPATVKKATKVYEYAYPYSYPMRLVIGTLPAGTLVDLQKFSGDGKHYRVLYANGTKAGWVACEDLAVVPKETPRYESPMINDSDANMCK